MKTLLLNCTILDGTPHMTPQKGKFVLIEDGIISDIGDGVPKYLKEEPETINLNGCYLMPGLINLHVHLAGSGKPQKAKRDNTRLANLATSNALIRKVTMGMCEGYARTQLLSGVTTIRTVGGLVDYDTRIRDRIQAGKLAGPRILASNRAISVEGGHMAGSVATIAHTAEDCRQQVRAVLDEGVDQVKIMITGGVMDADEKGTPGQLKMAPALVAACCEEAHAAGKKVAAHVESTEGLRVALENGVDSIEHGAEPDEEILELFKKTGACEICTISPTVPFTRFDRAITGIDDDMEHNGNVVLEGIISCTKKALENGIPVGLGTDTACSYVTHYDMWRELVYFQKLVGVTPAFALHTATLKNAELAGVSSITGSIRKGKAADMIVTLQNPLEDLRALRDPYMVLAGGKIYLKPKVKKIPACEQQLDAYMDTLYEV